MRDWLSAAKPGPYKVVLERPAYSGTLQRCRWKSAAGGENKLSTGTCSHSVTRREPQVTEPRPSQRIRRGGSTGFHPYAGGD
jgi:hypothetical protein